MFRRLWQKSGTAVVNGVSVFRLLPATAGGVDVRPTCFRGRSMRDTYRQRFVFHAQYGDKDCNRHIVADNPRRLRFELVTNYAMKGSILFAGARRLRWFASYPITIQG